MRNALAHAGKAQRRTPGSSPGTSAWIGTAFAQDNAEAARKQWRQVADQAKPRISKLAASMDNAEADVLAYMGFPAQHRTEIHSTNPLERLNGAIKRRSEVVGIFPNEAAVIRLGALLLEQNDKWAVQRARYMTLETIAPLGHDLSTRWDTILCRSRPRPLDRLCHTGARSADGGRHALSQANASLCTNARVALITGWYQQHRLPLGR